MANNLEERFYDDIRIWRWIRRIEKQTGRYYSLSNSERAKHNQDVNRLDKYISNYNIRDDELIDDILFHGEQLFPTVIIGDIEENKLGQMEGEFILENGPRSLYKSDQHYIDRIETIANEITNEDYVSREGEMNVMQEMLEDETLPNVVARPIVGVLEVCESDRFTNHNEIVVDQRFVYDAEELGIPLDTYLETATLPITKIYCKIVLYVFTLHQAGWIHGNLNTTNIFVKVDEDNSINSVKLIDFRDASRVTGNGGIDEASKNADYSSLWTSLGQEGMPPPMSTCIGELRNTAWKRRRHLVSAFHSATRKRRQTRRKKTLRKRR